MPLNTIFFVNLMWYLWVEHIEIVQKCLLIRFAELTFVRFCVTSFMDDPLATQEMVRILNSDLSIWLPDDGCLGGSPEVILNDSTRIIKIFRFVFTVKLR